jgi:fatty acid-binding protein DegV
MNQYEGLAGIYDSLIDTDYDKWTEFLQKYLSRHNINPLGKKVLELGCGTGNMTLRIKKMGMNVTAIDISQDMLSIASQKAADKGSKIMFLKQNMTSFNTGKKYDMIFSFCDGYNYVIEDKEITKSFERVYNHMNSGGIFIFDISTSYKLSSVLGNNTFTLNEDERCYIWDNYFEDNKIEMYITFFVKEGNLYRRFEERHIQKSHETEFIKEKLEIIRDTNEAYVLVGSLEQLHRSGRLTGLQFFLGSMLNIKPIISVDNGELLVKEKVRSEKKAIEKLVEYLRNSYEKYQFDEVYILYGLHQEFAVSWEKELKSKFPFLNFICCPLGATIGVHAGENTLGISWFNRLNQY